MTLILVDGSLTEEKVCLHVTAGAYEFPTVLSKSIETETARCILRKRSIKTATWRQKEIEIVFLIRIIVLY